MFLEKIKSQDDECSTRDFVKYFNKMAESLTEDDSDDGESIFEIMAELQKELKN